MKKNTLSVIILFTTLFFKTPFLATSCAQTITNLLTNGDFESGSVTPWENITNAQISTTAAHSGSYGVNIKGTGGMSTDQRWIRVTFGKTYVYSGWFKWNDVTIGSASGAWGFDLFTINDNCWQELGGLRNMHFSYPKDQWQKLAITFIPTNSCNSADPAVQVNFGVGGQYMQSFDVSFDDLLLFEKTGNLPPTLNPTANLSSGNVPLTVNFQANADDPDGAVKYYQWDFGDGSVETTNVAGHTYYKKGNYTVILTVWDDQGLSASKTLPISVTDTLGPSLAITYPTTQNTYTTSVGSITLSGTASAISGNITSLTYDNIHTGQANTISIAPAQNINWDSGPINLKPGKNEILITATDTAGRVETAKIFVSRTVSGPVVKNITVNIASVPVYEKYEVKFDLETVADNPFFTYDENPPAGVAPRTGVLVEGVFISPTNKVLRQPGFYYKEVSRTGTGTGTRYRETGKDGWAVRFSPQEVGQYNVSLHVKDASGETTLPVGTFTVSSFVKKGYIQVSKSDPRYFEFSNGEIHWPIGPAWGPNTGMLSDGTPYSQFKGSLNFERPWLIGTGAYTTNGARWVSSAQLLGNEGYMSQLSFKEHYPSSELAQEIYYPQGFRFTLGGGDQLRAELKANTQYQVKIRLKTMEIAGPVDSVSPYGFMIKVHDWPQNWDNLGQEIRSYPSMIPVVSQNRDWHTIVARYTANTRDASSGNQFISLFLDNVSAGKVYIDEFSLKEVLSDGSLGGELIRDSKADIHTNVQQRPTAYLDWQVSEGEQNDIFFQYVIQDKNDWVPNHLASNGIFTDVGDGYYQGNNTKAGWLQQQWWRYLVARWGYSTAVRSWELNNEGPPNSPAHWQKAQDFAKFMSQNDAHPHLAGTSFWGYTPNDFTDFFANKTLYPDVDYGDMHVYTRGDPLNYDLAAFINQWSSTLINLKIGKPIIMGEHGIVDASGQIMPELEQANTGVWYHNLLWSEINPGGVADPNYWFSSHFYFDGVYGRNPIFRREDVARPFAQFISSLDLNKGGYTDIAASSSNTNLRVYGQKNTASGKAHLWVQNKDHTWKNIFDGVNIVPQSGTITIQLVPNTDFNIEQWNAYTGALSSTQTLNSDASGNLTLNVSSLSDDIAVKIISSAIASDTTPPTVSITAPANGSTVGGVITISATASDNIGVLGVQFKLEGNNLGSEDTTSPYSISLDTTTLSNGNHTLTATARDAAGNSTASAVVSITVSNFTTIKGDVNDDNSVDVLDIQACVNHILGIQDLGARADVNQDGSVNVLDVQKIVNIILGVGG